MYLSGINATKVFVTDTNLYLLDPSALESFRGTDGEIHVVVIPQVVVNELDKKKADKNEEISLNARTTMRKILAYSADGLLGDGLVRIDDNYYFKIERKYDPSIDGRFANILGDDPDDIILKVALGIKESGQRMEIVTNDTGMLVKSMGLGFDKGEFGKWKGIRAIASIDLLYKGWQKLEMIGWNLLKKFNSEHYLDRGLLEGIIMDACGRAPYPNEYFYTNNGFKARYDHKQERFIYIVGAYSDSRSIGIDAKNVPQEFAIDALLRPEIVQVNLIGPAGSGKTMLAMIAGLSHVTYEGSMYNKIIAIRPLIASGKELGFFKGTKDDKLMPWVGAFLDNLELGPDRILKKASQRRVKHQKGEEEGEEEDYNERALSVHEYLKEKGLLEFEAMAYLKGRTFKDKWVVLDEAEDLTPNQGELACSRIGDFSKIVLTGDTGQIHNNVLDEVTNGLVVASETMKSSGYSATVFLPEVLRSDYAAAVAKLYTERRKKIGERKDIGCE